MNGATTTSSDYHRLLSQRTSQEAMKCGTSLKTEVRVSLALPAAAMTGLGADTVEGGASDIARHELPIQRPFLRISRAPAAFGAWAKGLPGKLKGQTTAGVEHVLDVHKFARTPDGVSGWAWSAVKGRYWKAGHGESGR